MNRVIVGVGSNIDPTENVELAISALSYRYAKVARSRFVITKPIGYASQPDYLNGAVRFDTAESHDEVGRTLRRIEDDLGRTRTQNKYGPRTIDLDIVVWNGEIVDPDFYSRDFLRRSVLELEPGLNQTQIVSAPTTQQHGGKKR